MSGGTAASSTAQFAAELQCTNREERETILREAGILSSEDVPEEECLAMKASLAIPWNKLRHIRRYVSYIRLVYNAPIIFKNYIAFTK